MVYDDQIEYFLKKCIKIRNTVKVVNHPMICSASTLDVKMSSNITIFAPSNSNDESEFDNLYELLSSRSDITAYIKSQEYLKQNEKVCFSNDWISTDDYERLFLSADVILLSIGDRFKYRASGVLFEAIANQRYVLTNNKYLYDAYLKKFPSIGGYYSNISDLSEMLNTLDLRQKNTDEYDRFYFEHSDQFIENQLNNVLLSER
ncbi:hypothetical protein WG909_07575 [Peptostreptococcaceae bacterium AGR-M142]